MSNDSKSVGLLLVGHGTRDAVGVRQFLELAEGLKQAFAHAMVEAVFLELAQPDIAAGVGRFLESGVVEIVTVPVILFAAGHVKRDIPGEVAAAVAAKGRSDVRQVQVGHLGCHEALVELSRVRMEEARRETSRGGAEARSGRKRDEGGICLLLVARGSKDEEARAEMLEFGRLRQAEMPGVKVEVAFLAKAKPSFEEKLAELKALSRSTADAADARPAVATEGTGSRFAPGYSRIIVQPHFLFEGELVERLRGQIAGIAALDPETEWILTQPLADEPGNQGLASELLAKVIRDRCRAAGFVLS